MEPAGATLAGASNLGGSGRPSRWQKARAYPRAMLARL
jgi:hypothetical protein